LTAVGDSDNGVNADANWKRVITKKKECEAAVLAILEAPDDDSPILLTTHRVWKTKKNASKLKSINKSIKDAKKDEEVIEAKKVAIKKKAAEKRKATTASAAAATGSIDLTE
jgi:preprotein translocase subunit SecA